MHGYSVTKGAQSQNAKPHVAPDELPCSGFKARQKVNSSLVRCFFQPLLNELVQ
jgi:hypothetical protein